MVRTIFLTAVLLLALNVFSQQNNFVEAGLLKTNLSFSQSFMIQHANQNVYINGHLEYFTSKFVSFRGDAFWYVDSRQKDQIFKQNYLVQFGALFHKQLSISDLYIGIQPGFSYTQPISPVDLQNKYPTRLMPNLNLLAGYTLYFSKFCDINIGVNYLISRYRGAENGSVKLDELMISGGLGFHIKTKK